MSVGWGELFRWAQIRELSAIAIIECHHEIDIQNLSNEKEGF